MTRDQAIQIAVGVIERNSANISSMSVVTSIDTYIALGILKVEEPETLEQRLCKALGWPIGSRSERELVEALASCGLKLEQVAP